MDASASPTVGTAGSTPRAMERGPIHAISSPSAHANGASGSARKHDAAVQDALQRQLKAFEDRVGKELGGLANSPVAAGALGGSSAWPAATQAAIAAALEACVKRLTDSEAWIGAVDMEVRQLRTNVEHSNRALDCLGAQLGAGHERLTGEFSPRTSKGSRIREPVADFPHHSGYAGSACTIAQRVARLESELSHLSLKVPKPEFVTRRELSEVTEAIRNDVSHLQGQATRSERSTCEIRQDLDGLRDSFGDLLLRTSDTISRRELTETAENVQRELKHLSDQVARLEKLEREAAENLLDAQMVTVYDKKAGDVAKSTAEPIAALERSLDNLRSELTGAVAELSDSTQIMCQELTSLREKIAVEESRLSAVVDKMSQGTSRQELQEVTKLLSEVKDTSKLLKDEEVVLTRNELHNATEFWRQELAAMSGRLSQNLAREPVPVVQANWEIKSTLTREELDDVTDLFKKEVDELSRRVHQLEPSVSKGELAETVNLLKQEFLVSCQKAVHSDNVSLRQQLIDTVEMMRRELADQSEMSAAGLSESVQQEIRQQIESVSVRLFEHLWKERFGVALRQEVLQELEHQNQTARRDRERMDQHVQDIEDRLQTRCGNDISRFYDHMRNEVSDIAQRLGKIEFTDNANLSTRERFASLHDRLEVVEKTLKSTIPAASDIAVAYSKESVSFASQGTSGMSSALKDSMRLNQDGEHPSGLDSKPPVALGKPQKNMKVSFAPEVEGDMMQMFADFRKEHQQWHSIMDTLLSQYTQLNDRVSGVESRWETISNITSRLDRIELECAKIPSLSSQSAPMPPLQFVRARTTAQDMVPIAEVCPRVGDEQSRRGTEHLEKIIEALAKRFDELRESMQRSSASTLPSGVGGEGIVPFNQKDQNTDMLLGATLNERIGGLCDRVEAVEQKIMTAVNGGISESVGDLDDTIECKVVAAVQSQCSSFSTRLDNIESALASASTKLSNRRSRVASVQDYLGADFEFKVT